MLISQKRAWNHRPPYQTSTKSSRWNWSYLAHAIMLTRPASKFSSCHYNNQDQSLTR